MGVEKRQKKRHSRNEIPTDYQTMFMLSRLITEATLAELCKRYAFNMTKLIYKHKSQEDFPVSLPSVFGLTCAA